MDSPKEELIKHRDINFCAADPNADNAEDAVQLLTDVDGVLEARTLDKNCVSITYNLGKISLSIIEEALQEIGFELDNSLINKIRRAICYYTEETQLENMGHVGDDSKSTTGIFINQYNLREHGCRDQRPPWYHHYN